MNAIAHQMGGAKTQSSQKGGSSVACAISTEVAVQRRDPLDMGIPPYIGKNVSPPEIRARLSDIGAGQHIPVEANSDRDRYGNNIVTFPKYWPKLENSDTLRRHSEQLVTSGAGRSDGAFGKGQMQRWLTSKMGKRYLGSKLHSHEKWLHGNPSVDVVANGKETEGEESKNRSRGDLILPKLKYLMGNKNKASRGNTHPRDDTSCSSTWDATTIEGDDS